MKLHGLLKTKDISKKRVGRGQGSGRGKTAGRGTKGQKARGKIPLAFSGDLSFYKKLPKKRGLGNSKILLKSKTIKLSLLNIFPNKTTIDIEQLLRQKLISAKEGRLGVKILEGGEFNKVLTIKLPVSKKAKDKIIKLGGKVE